MCDKNCQYLSDKLNKWNMFLSEKQKEQFYRYYEMINQWNEVMNLTGITEYHEVMDKHYLDSLALGLISEIVQKDNLKLIDVGTGAGFPGIPLKIMFPNWNVTLIDSLSKRIKFLDAVVSELGLSDVELIHTRAEDLAKNESYRDQYDVATSRAVANLSSLSEICLPFVKKDGIFVSYKSERGDEEVNESTYAISELSGKFRNIFQFNLPNTDILRSLVIIDKVDSTSSKYPRKAGLAFKRPLTQS